MTKVSYMWHLTCSEIALMCSEKCGFLIADKDKPVSLGVPLLVACLSLTVISVSRTESLQLTNSCHPSDTECQLVSQRQCLKPTG